jgi:hypothetical protein
VQIYTQHFQSAKSFFENFLRPSAPMHRFRPQAVLLRTLTTHPQMKKYAFVLLAGSIIGLSACGSDSNTDTTQAQIDSAANARTAELEAAHQAQTDSILNEMARMKADSAAMADSLAQAANTTSSTVTKTTTTTKTTKPTKPATPPRSNTPTSVNDRPGGNGAGTNSKGQTTNDNTPKNVNDRPGGN